MKTPAKRLKGTIKALFFDIDGTLVDHADHRIPQSAQRALWAAHRQGYLLFVATGRNPSELEEVPGISALPFSGVVASNGQFCYCGQRVVHSSPIPKGDIEVLMDYLDETPCPCLFTTQNSLFLSRLTPLVQEIQDSLGLAIPPVRPHRDALLQDIYQVGMVIGHGAVPPVVGQMTHCSWTRWHGQGIDIYPQEGGKWAGVLKMLEHFNLAPQQAMAFGDNDNDVEMLQQAGYSVALLGGTQAAQAAADTLAPEPGKHGIAKALHQLLGVI